MKTNLRKQFDKEISNKLLLKNASVWAISKHLMCRLGLWLKSQYKAHTQLVWESLAGIGWAMFVLTFVGVV